MTDLSFQIGDKIWLDTKTIFHLKNTWNYANWSAGRLVWDIPIGWFRMMAEDDQMHVISDCEYEVRFDENSRPLLIGGKIDAYKQIFTITEDGTASVEKHGHTMSRSR